MKYKNSKINGNLLSPKSCFPLCFLSWSLLHLYRTASTPSSSFRITHLLTFSSFSSPTSDIVLHSSSYFKQNSATFSSLVKLKGSSLKTWLSTEFSSKNNNWRWWGLTVVLTTKDTYFLVKEDDEIWSILDWKILEILRLNTIIIGAQK